MLQCAAVPGQRLPGRRALPGKDDTVGVAHSHAADPPAAPARTEGLLQQRPAAERLRAHGIPGSGKAAHLGLPQPCAHTAQDAPPGARRVDAQAVPPHTVGV